MRYRVRHITKVRYDARVQLARFNLRLKPVEWPGQTLLNFRMEISPEPEGITTELGPYLANVSRLSIAEPLAELVVTSDFDVDVHPVQLIFKEAGLIIEQVRALAMEVRDNSRTAPAAYLFASQFAPLEPEIAEWSRTVLRQDQDIMVAAMALTQFIHDSFAYDPNATESNTPVIEAFRQKRGVCQDFAHVMIAALRAQGIPAAYVSGYLRTIPPAGQPRMVGADATHAWVNVWCGPQFGWVGFDPTNACRVGVDHIFTAMGRDYADVAPVDGVFMGSSGQHLDVSVDVAPMELSFN